MTTEHAIRIVEFAAVLAGQTNRGTAWQDSVELMDLSGRISRLRIAECNYELSPRQQARLARMYERAEAICRGLPGILRIEHPDPRAGLGLRLVFASGIYNDFGGTGWNIPTL